MVWIFGIGAMISLFISHQQKSRSGIFVGKLCADIFWSAHYIFLGAIAGAIPNFAGIFRELVFVNRTRHPLANKAILPCVFLAYDVFVGSYMGIVNESVAILSIILFFIKGEKKHGTF